MANMKPPTLFTREALEEIEKQLRRNQDSIVMPQCLDGTRQVIRNRGNTNRSRDPDKGEFLYPNTVWFRGDEHYEALSVEEKGAYRSVHILNIEHKGPQFTPVEIINKLATAMVTVRNSNELGHIKDFILENKHAFSTVNKIIGFGLGRLEHNDRSPRPKPVAYPSPAMLQHAMIYKIAEIIKDAIKPPHGTPKVYIQDPLYTSSDKIALTEECRMTVVDGFGAKAFLMVDENTMVVSQYPAFPMREVVLDLARPAIMWAQGVNRSSMADPVPGRTRKIMAKEYQEYSEPRSDTFNQNCWHIRKTLSQTVS